MMACGRRTWFNKQYNNTTTMNSSYSTELCTNAKQQCILHKLRCVVHKITFHYRQTKHKITILLPCTTLFSLFDFCCICYVCVYIHCMYIFIIYISDKLAKQRLFPAIELKPGMPNLIITAAG